MIQTYNVHELEPNKLVDALHFCGTASRLDADKVGWLPLQAYRDGIAQQRLVICKNNDDTVGFILWGHNHAQIKVYQIWVRADARMIEHGRALVSHVDSIARQRRAWRLRAWVAEDLAANIFWNAIGFEQISWRYSNRKNSKRRHLLWVRPVLEHDPQIVIPPHDLIV